MIKQIGLPLRGRPILLITRMITDRIGLHSVLLPLLIKMKDQNMPYHLQSAKFSVRLDYCIYYSAYHPDVNRKERRSSFTPVFPSVQHQRIEQEKLCLKASYSQLGTVTFDTYISQCDMRTLVFFWRAMFQAKSRQN